jgi:glycosyltransferase involved in cell wall biosynthesis
MNRPRLDRGSPILAGADLVHAPSPAIPPRGSKPLVATIHDVAFELHPEVFPRRGRRFHQMGLAAAVRRADLVITVSNSAADEITERAPALASRLRVVHNGVEHIEADPSEIASTVALLGLGQRPYVLWVGSLEPRKDVGTLISAFARMSQLSDDTGHDLVLVGPAGWLGGGQIDEADVSRLGERLHRVGEVGDAALRCLYAGADLFALPSRHEGFGLPVLEAMAQGTAVVCSDIPALREVTAGTARLVEPGDVESWVVALGSLLGDPLARDVLGRAGAERSREFTWERTLAATREVYLEALAG